MFFVVFFTLKKVFSTVSCSLLTEELQCIVVDYYLCSYCVC